MYDEIFFKIIFFIAVVVFCITIIGFFLLAIKIMLLFAPEIKLIGLTIS